MNVSRRAEEQARRKQELLEAATLEQRLLQRVKSEREAERHWLERAELATSRGEPSLADEARRRAAEHGERAGYLEAEYFEQQTHVVELRQAARLATGSAGGGAAAAPPVDETVRVERRLAELEEETTLEDDLNQLKRRRSGSSDSTPTA
jgi:hypothetical protein